MKISIISTVFNEEKNISKFMDSLIGQGKKPDEIIIVDGGSSDKTYDILKKYTKKNNKIKVFRKNGVNIAKGRNIAISKTRNEVVVGADAGTKYDKKWLENLTKGFKEDVGFGKTLPLIESNFQKVLAKKLKQRYGSSRNIIFKKDAWKAVGGYPEDLKMAEDTVFNIRLKMAGFKETLIPDAIGYWEMREDLEGVRKQFYNYGFWDGVAYRKYRMLPFKNKVAVGILIILLPLYPLFWIISKFSLSFRIDFVRRFAYLNGILRGLTK